MWLFVWLMACGPSQEQLDCLSECNSRKNSFPGLKKCTQQQLENHERRKSEINALQNLLVGLEGDYAKSAAIYKRYKDECFGYLSSGPEDAEAKARRYLQLCEGKAYERIKPHEEKVQMYDFKKKQVSKIQEKLDEFDSKGGAESICKAQQLNLKEVDCDLECKVN